MTAEFWFELIEFVMKVLMLLIDLFEWLRARKGKERPLARKDERPK